MATKPRGRSPEFWIDLPQATFLPNYSYCISGLGGDFIYLFIFYLFIFIFCCFFIECCHCNKTKLPLVIKHELDRQSSIDHNCQIWFISLHWLWRKCNLSIFPIVSLWEFSDAMTTKRLVTIILAGHHNFSYLYIPYLSNILTSFGGVVVSKGSQKEGWTDDGQKSDHYSSF